MEQITVAGGGTLGSQIAYQIAFSGKNVTLYDISADAIAAAEKRLSQWDTFYQADMQATETEIAATHARIKTATTLADAVSTETELVIEAIPENLGIKESFYRELGDVAPEATIFASNSSSMTPDELAHAVDRPQQFLNLHFANHIWKHNIAEIMPSAETDPTVVDQVEHFAQEIGMVPIVLHKEKPGYVLNSLLIPFLSSAMELWGGDYAEPESIDQAWMIGTGAPSGPFGMIDVVGLRGFYTIHSQVLEKEPDTPANRQALAGMQKIKQMLDAGKLGVESGEGFYTYPDPAFRDPNFLK